MIRAIIFDCFGVLTEDSWREFTATLSPEVGEHASALNRAYDAGITTLEEFLSQTHQLTGRDPAYIEGLISGERSKNTPLLDYIAQLKEHFKIGLLSNVGTDWVRESFLTADEQLLFDDMVLSFEVHLAKPDPRIFLLACERLGVAPYEAVLVDDVERYCTAARAERMQAIVYQDIQQFHEELVALLDDQSDH